MPKYYVNDNAQDTGEHEVHEEGCTWLELTESKTYLGEFPSCHGAVEKAKDYYDDVDGCAYCCPDCNTR